MEKVRLRHHNAEELIAKAKEQAIIREQQLQMLRSKGQVAPPEASLLGCWQVIEKTYLHKNDPPPFTLYPDFQLGDYLTFFRFLGPDNYLYGESISCGEATWGPNHGELYRLDNSSFDVTGRIVNPGRVRYRELPVLGKVQFLYNSIGQPWARSRQIPRLLDANWQGWEMEGKSYNETGELEFKAVRVGQQI